MLIYINVINKYIVVIVLNIRNKGSMYIIIYLLNIFNQLIVFVQDLAGVKLSSIC